MTSSEYFHYLRETTEETEKYLKTFFQALKFAIPHRPLSLAKKNSMSRARTKRPKIRPAVVRLGYEICGGTRWRKIIPICAAVELLNISTYTFNQIFDEKGEEAWSKTTINEHIIAGILQREFVNRMITYASLKLSSQTTLAIHAKLEEIQTVTYLGQYTDLFQLKANTNLPRYKQYLKQYVNRCYFFGGKFYENALIIGGILANADQKQLQALGSFGNFFGTSLQMVNDLGNFVPPDRKPYQEAFKFYQDQYGDVRMGKLTLPIYLMLAGSPKKEGQFILKQKGTKRTTKQDGYRLTRLLIRSGALKTCKKLTNRYVREAKQSLLIFPKSTPRDLLSAMTSNVKSSCYWKILKSIMLE